MFIVPKSNGWRLNSSVVKLTKQQRRWKGCSCMWLSTFCWLSSLTVCIVLCRVNRLFCLLLKGSVEQWRKTVLTVVILSLFFFWAQRWYKLLISLIARTMCFPTAPFHKPSIATMSHWCRHCGTDGAQLSTLLPGCTPAATHHRRSLVNCSNFRLTPDPCHKPTDHHEPRLQTDGHWHTHTPRTHSSVRKKKGKISLSDKSCCFVWHLIDRTVIGAAGRMSRHI